MQLTDTQARELGRRLLAARSRLLAENGFYGLLLMHMSFAIGDELDTAWVDTSDTITFNPEFASMLSADELCYVLEHEVLHAALGHLRRDGGRDPWIWNIAADIVVHSNIMHSNGDRLESISLACEAGEALGARYYIMHGTFDNRGSRLRPRGIYRLRENMELLRQIAASHHLEVLWENVFWCTARTPEDIADIREILPEQRFVLDVKQAWRAGTEPMAMIDAMGPKLAHVHALDHTPDMQKLALPGSGVLDWPALIHRMRGYGFDGAILLEPYAWQCADDGDTRRCLKYLRTCIQEEEARCTDGNA